MNSAPFFNAQFFDNDGLPLSGGLLYTYTAGTTTPETTYTDQAGTSPNTNPIVLDAAGRCDLWLTPAIEYKLTLQRADTTVLKTWDNVGSVGTTSAGVSSVNAASGDVILAAGDIGFTTTSSATWFSGSDVSTALDSIINRVDNPVSSTVVALATNVSIADAGGLITGTNVETALQELAARVQLPSQAASAGKYLTTNGTTPSWANPSLSTFTATIPSGDLTVAVSSGTQTYGTRSVSVTGGSGTLLYSWMVTEGEDRSWDDGSSTGTSVDIKGTGTGLTKTFIVTCFVQDDTGRMTSARFTVAATHA